MPWQVSDGVFVIHTHSILDICLEFSESKRIEGRGGKVQGGKGKSEEGYQ